MLDSWTYEYIYTVEFQRALSKNPIKLVPPWWVEDQEKPADNLDIAQASFELPWQIHPSLNPTPTPIPFSMQFHL